MSINNHVNNITEGDINKTLKNLTIPMIFGVLGMVAFNLSDTYFVGKLGTDQMAALSFTFPVVLILNSLNLGIGIGTSSVISKAVGEKDREKVIRLSTDSISLGFIVALIIALIGFFTIRPLFTLLGSKKDTIGYITEYMKIWYLGAPLVVVPMIGNNAIRALGDTKTPSFVMLLSAVVNIILDPLFIFGVGFFPELGVKGAAIATVIARGLTFLVSLYVLIVREKVISLKSIKLKELISSWKTILFIGVPNSISKMIVPIGVGIVTNIISNFGTSHVAGFGIASKIEIFALSIVNALSAIIPIFVGQNFGSKKIDRIKKSVIASEKFSIFSGLIIYALLIFLARPISYIFTKDKNVSDIVVTYLRIVPIGYAFQGMLLIITAALNALNKPIKASLLSLSQTLLIYVPLAIFLSKHLKLKGIFIALIFSYILTGIASHFIIHREINILEKSATKTKRL